MMALELIDESKIEVMPRKDAKKRKDDRKDIGKTRYKAFPAIEGEKGENEEKGEKGSGGSKIILENVSIISCERIKSGMTSSCSICNELHKDFFGRCRNKWNYDVH